MADRDESTSERSDNTAASGSNGPSITLIALLIVAVLATVLFLRNGDETTVDFVFFKAETTVRWSILMAIVFGVALDRLFSMWWRRRKRRKDA